MSSLFAPRPPSYPWGKPAAGIDVLWRAEAKRYSVAIDPDRDLYGTSHPTLEMRWFRVAKRTPCGARIHRLDGGMFVNLKARKQYACETEALALASFKARTERHLRILRKRVERCEADLALLPEGA